MIETMIEIVETLLVLITGLILASLGWGCRDLIVKGGYYDLDDP